MTFDTPESLFKWHLAHWDTDEDADYAEVGDTRCPWCECRIYRLYHESGCPVRALITAYRKRNTMMTKFKIYEDLYELFRTASQAIGDGDDAVKDACNDLVLMYDAAAKAEDPRASFIEMLKASASYSSWEPGT